MVIEYDKNDKAFTINTDQFDPVMIIGLLQGKMSEQYEITSQGDDVEIQHVACIEI